MTGRGLRLGLFTGTGRVLTGVLGAGLFTYLFLGLAGRVLGPDDFTPVSTLWALVFIVGPGLFIPFQQELGRLLALHREARSGRQAVIRMGYLVLGLVGAAMAACLLLRQWLTDVFFGRDSTLFWCLFASVASYALTYFARGVLAGLGDYALLGRLIVLESVARLAVASGLVLLGARSGGAFGVAIAVAPVISTFVVTRLGFKLRLAAGAVVGWGTATRSIGWLIAAAVAAQTLANAGPLAVQALAEQSEQGQAGRFLSALVLSRLGLYVFQAVQATLLPNFAIVVASGRSDEVLDQLRRITAMCVALVAGTAATAWAAGPAAVALLFGQEFAVSRVTMAILTGASGCYVFALALSSAAVGAGGHRFSAAAWISGCLGFAGGTVLVEELFLRVEVGYLVGSGVTALVLLVGLRGAVRRGSLGAVTASPSP